MPLERECMRFQAFRQPSAALAAGGVECWDRRRPGKPQLRSPLSWGMTGSGALDSAQVHLSCA